MIDATRFDSRRLVPYLAIGLLSAACYANTLVNTFVFDDLQVIVHNPLVTGPLDVLRIFRSHYWQHLTAGGNLYRPLTILTFALNHLAGGLAPFGYHVVNMLLHIVCSCLVFLLAGRLGLGRGASLAAAALFAAHPVHTEAVTGVVGRAELMATAAVLAGWVIHLGARRATPARTALVASCLAAGLLSKENAVVLPALALAGDLYRRRRGEIAWRQVVPAHLTFGVMVFAWLAFRVWFLPPVVPGSIADTVFSGAPIGYRIYTALSVLLRYVWLLIFPLKLSADYSFAQIPAVTSPESGLTLGGAAVLAVAAVGGACGLLARSKTRGRMRLVALCAAIFCITIAPVSNLVVPIGTIMAERLLYLPSLSFCLGIAALWSTLAAGRRNALVGFVLTSLLVTSYGARALVRNRDWRDQLTLFTATVATSPNSAKAHYNLGVALEENGRPVEALRQYREALAIREDDAGAHRNAGLLLAAQGRLPAAVADLERAAALDPNLPGVLSDLGVVYNRLGRPAEAEAALREALLRHPRQHDALYNLGTLLLASHRASEALPYLQRAASIDPENADGRYQLGLAYLDSDRPAEAIAEFTAARALSPGLEDIDVSIALAYLRLGRKDEAATAAARARQAGVSLPAALRDLLP
ncbi:MAG: tetratricopeptide repeat protein [Acidobacteriota bacterium]